MNLERDLSNFTGFTVVWVVLALLFFGSLNLLNVPTGSFLNWVLATAMFWWLIVITTVPWNIYFSARAAAAEAEQSRQRQIQVDEGACQYVDRLQRWMLMVAVGLHTVSALSLYGLAATGIAPVGYLGSVAALLLTGLRPAIAAYRYLMQRLADISQDLKYPRQDVVTLTQQVATVTQSIQQIRHQQDNLALQLDPKEASSWVARQQRSLEHLQAEIARVGTAHATLKAANQADHQRLALEARNAIAQLNEDSEFLDRVRDIIRFWKAV